ncbi:hypothetical protein PLESTF_000511700 [Pleodorina starrii]|nr:hypothetical protein PLESTF_000511700 [Pleodorina starrii]
MRRHGRTLTKIEVRCLAAEMEAIEAKAAGHKPRWDEGAAASEKWWRGYKQRHGVVLRSTQHAEAERQAAATSDVVYGFFDTFQKVCTDIKITPERIFNFDESGVSDEGRWLPGVAEAAGVPEVKRLQDTSVHGHTTLMAACNSAGFIAPAFLRKGVRYVSNLLAFTQQTMPRASILHKTDSAYFNGPTLYAYLDFFKVEAERVVGAINKDNPVLVVCDGHESRFEDDFVSKARDEGIHILVFPGKLTHLLQPCDQTFGSFKRKLGSLRALHANQKGQLSMQEFMKLIGEAWQATMTSALFPSS